MVCKRNGFRWSKIGVGVNVKEGENVGIYGMKKEHTLEDFERVKKLLNDSNKRLNKNFLKKDKYSIGDLKRINLILFWNLEIDDFDHSQNVILNQYNRLNFRKKYLI